LKLLHCIPYGGPIFIIQITCIYFLIYFHQQYILLNWRVYSDQYSSKNRTFLIRREMAEYRMKQGPAVTRQYMCMYVCYSCRCNEVTLMRGVPPHRTTEHRYQWRSRQVYFLRERMFMTSSHLGDSTSYALHLLRLRQFQVQNHRLKVLPISVYFFGL
jgi:hypothetical protein